MKTTKQYLKEAYQRVLIPDEATGTFTAMVKEFPGCVAQGDTVEEAYANLLSAAESWIEAAHEMGQEIPPPSADDRYSGRVLVRFPKSLHRGASEAASRDGTSLNQYIVAAVAEKIGAGRVQARTHYYISQDEAWQLAPPLGNTPIQFASNLLDGSTPFLVHSDFKPGSTVNMKIRGTAKTIAGATQGLRR